MAKILCYSKKDFDRLMEANGWCDGNVPADVAIISICCTEDCIAGWFAAHDLDAVDEHYFKQKTEQVFNVEFDDIIQDSFVSNGYTYRCITEQQAYDLVKFIWSNLGKDIYVHCRAGKSRSQAVTQFVLDYFDKYYTEFREDNPPRSPNGNVLAKLKRAYDKINDEDPEKYDYKKVCSKA